MFPSWVMKRLQANRLAVKTPAEPWPRWTLVLSAPLFSVEQGAGGHPLLPLAAEDRGLRLGPVLRHHLGQRQESLRKEHGVGELHPQLAGEFWELKPTSLKGAKVRGSCAGWGILGVHLVTVQSYTGTEKSDIIDFHRILLVRRSVHSDTWQLTRIYDRCSVPGGVTPSQRGSPIHLTPVLQNGAKLPERLSCLATEMWGLITTGVNRGLPRQSGEICSPKLLQDGLLCFSTRKFP
ncbi:hypothetical protein L345_15858, partial [Ophiophagus hannah]